MIDGIIAMMRSGPPAACRIFSICVCVACHHLRCSLRRVRRTSASLPVRSNLSLFPTSEDVQSEEPPTARFTTTARGARAVPKGLRAAASVPKGLRRGAPDELAASGPPRDRTSDSSGSPAAGGESISGTNSSPRNPADGSSAPLRCASLGCRPLRPISVRDGRLAHLHSPSISV